MNLNKHMKRLTVCLLFWLLCCCFCSCNAGVISTEPSDTEAISESVQTTVKPSVSESSTEAPLPATESTSGTTATTATTTAASTTESTVTTTAATKAATTEKPATTGTTAAKKETNTCTLTIDCTAAGKGYTLQNYSVTVKDGDTAYDILCRGCQANNISINASPTGYGIYVAGINGLDQKEVGENSGWMYYINGTAPQKACSKYKVSAGDTVLFYYTVDYSTP